MKFCGLIFLILTAFLAKGFAFVCDNGVEIKKENRCNDNAHCSDCSDENNCTGGEVWKPCGTQYPPYCYKESEECDGHSHCLNCRDEENCSENAFLFHCADGNGCVRFQNLSRHRSCPRGECNSFCDGIKGCDDGSDEVYDGFGFRCENLGKNPCVVPQQYIAKWREQSEQQGAFYGICPNGQDHCFDQVTGTLNVQKCWPCLNGDLLAREQFCDNKIFDCPDLSDECLCENSKLCENITKAHECSKSEIPCSGQGPCINVSQVCDGTTQCPNGFDEAHCAECKDCIGRIEKCDYRPQEHRAADECDGSCEDPSDYCDDINPWDGFVRRPNESACMPHFRKLCDKVQDCLDGFDERHCPNVLLCGSGSASDTTATRYFKGSDECDHIFHCEDRRDELNCSFNTHFYCDQNQTILRMNQVGDGNIDCVEDFTDECEDSGKRISSRTHMIGSIALYVALWIMMILSITGNSIVIWKTAKDLASMLRRRLNCSPHRVSVCNKTMILNLAISDFLMGIYLLWIAIRSLVFGDKFCQNRVKWVTGPECSLLGTLSMLSAQTSVLIMVLMTTYRLYGVMNPFRAEKVRCKAVNAAIVVIWLTSLLLAVVPLFPWRPNLFVVKLYINEPYTRQYGVNAADVKTMLADAQRLPNADIDIASTADLQSTFCGLFPASCENPQNLKVAGYYAFDSVCIPRFYSNPSDPASSFTIFIMAFNFIAFLYMLTAYCVIYRLTSKDEGGIRTSNHRDSEVDLRHKENRALWGKIVRLVMTDLVCWVPICVTSFLSFAGVTIPDEFYPITAIILFPINSALNPWIYSAVLKNILSKIRFLKRVIPVKTHQPNKIGQSRSHSDLTFPSENNQGKFPYFACLGANKRSMDMGMCSLPNSPSSQNNTQDGLTLATEL
ncbi:unnamed protein product [Clavelina lepadiformis]|uniref:G-protein coupled receptors family 1 profile domain-containing protein n=1 Tax=Clavelina lepadiformis TaxID=159417 RepID=A0ABP0G6Y4_CLALP